MMQTGLGEIDDDEIYRIEREYPQKKPHIYRKPGVLFF